MIYRAMADEELERLTFMQPGNRLATGELLNRFQDETTREDLSKMVDSAETEAEDLQKQLDATEAECEQLQKKPTAAFGALRRFAPNAGKEHGSGKIWRKAHAGPWMSAIGLRSGPVPD